MGAKVSAMLVLGRKADTENDEDAASGGGMDDGDGSVGGMDDGEGSVGGGAPLEIDATGVAVDCEGSTTTVEGLTGGAGDTLETTGVSVDGGGRTTGAVEDSRGDDGAGLGISELDGTYAVVDGGAGGWGVCDVGAAEEDSGTAELDSGRMELEGGAAGGVDVVVGGEGVDSGVGVTLL